MRFLVFAQVFIFSGLGLAQIQASLGRVAQTTTTFTTEPAPASFHPFPLANVSSPHVEVTIEIQIGNLSGSGIISLTNFTTTSGSRGPESVSLLNSTPTVHYDQTDRFPTMCSATSWSNATAIPPYVANSTFSFNATAMPSARPFATPTPADLSILTGAGVLSKRSFPVSALLSTIFVHIALVLV